MTDPRVARRLALLLSAITLVALACTCNNPLNTLRANNANDALTISTEGGINGRAWLDRNGNGLQDQGEEGVSAVTVQLVDERGTVADETSTGEDGTFAFVQVAGGTYALGFSPPEGLGFTVNGAGSDASVDSDVLPASGQTELFRYNGVEGVTLDAGLVPEPPRVTDTPRPTATSAAAATEELAQDVPQVHITYVHHKGYSDIVISFTNLSEGQEISGEVVGDGLLGDGHFTAVGSADGTCEIPVDIGQYGKYQVNIPELGISESVVVVQATATPF